MSYALRVACPARSQNDQQRELITKKNARRTCFNPLGRNRNEHDGRRLAPAVANAWLALREELAGSGQAQSSSGSERR